MHKISLVVKMHHFFNRFYSLYDNIVLLYNTTHENLIIVRCSTKQLASGQEHLRAMDVYFRSFNLFDQDVTSLDNA